MRLSLESNMRTFSYNDQTWTVEQTGGATLAPQRSMGVDFTCIDTGEQLPGRVIDLGGIERLSDAQLGEALEHARRAMKD